jgi:hypothetical protein
MNQLLHFEMINGHELRIQQELIDISPMGGQTWREQGPFVPGLKFATLDGTSISLDALRAFLTTIGRGDLIVEFKIPASCHIQKTMRGD